MNPSDWLADCMSHDYWQHDPFSLDGVTTTCDGSAVVAWPSHTGYAPPRFDEDQDCSGALMANIALARDVTTYPYEGSIKDLGLIEQHEARFVAAREGLQLAIEPTRIFFHFTNPETGELEAYGVIYKGAQAA